jgi:GTP-binding protein EngB required for normal cell division
MDQAALATIATELADAAVGHHDIAVAASRLAERIEQGQFHVAVVGEFKRGKSTFINALLGAAVLPTGVLPLTAVATEVADGPAGATVVALDGSTRRIGLDELAAFVTEAGNPGNERKVGHVEVRVPHPLLASGLVLVDTPGVGSVHAHNTEAAHAAYRDADGAIVVLAADAPLSQAERDTLGYFTARDARTFVVLNKVDHLSAVELDEVQTFIADMIDRPDLTVWPISARAALESALQGRDIGADAGEFTAFAAAFDRFVQEDLVAERDGAYRRELVQLTASLVERVRLELAAATLDTEQLAARVASFRSHAVTQREALDADRLLLAEQTRNLAAEMGSRLAGHASEAAARRTDELIDAAEGVPVSRLEDHLRAVIESIVRDELGSARDHEAKWLEARWASLAARFRTRTEERAAAVQAAAADLFAVELTPIDIPSVTDEPDRFTFLFLYLPIGSDPLTHLVARLIPAPVRRRRLLRRGVAQLAQELDKHAGRARVDLNDRLSRTRSEFEALMVAALDAYIDQILAAAARGDDLRQQGQAALDQHRDLLARAERLAERVEALGDQSRGDSP